MGAWVEGTGRRTGAERAEMHSVVIGGIRRSRPGFADEGAQQGLRDQGGSSCTFISRFIPSTWCSMGLKNGICIGRWSPVTGGSGICREQGYNKGWDTKDPGPG